MKKQQLQTQNASPIDRPGLGSEQGIPSLANSFPRDFPTFITVMNCQANPKPGMSQSQTLPGAIALEAGAHFSNASYNDNRKRRSAIKVAQRTTITTDVGSGWLCILFLKCQDGGPRKSTRLLVVVE
jgi:hypothetical protein